MHIRGPQSRDGWPFFIMSDWEPDWTVPQTFVKPLLAIFGNMQIKQNNKREDLDQESSSITNLKGTLQTNRLCRGGTKLALWAATFVSPQLTLPFISVDSNNMCMRSEKEAWRDPDRVHFLPEENRRETGSLETQFGPPFYCYASIAQQMHSIKQQGLN
ncbi:hypothetical protein LSTR_LSTR004065 [Laodelphax striatellus]|uniref:Uncharacterized protein n=1 Tax=Laodelphax striatellus TaxID=195883 RepID=A0A482WFY8_LAOST|nr:hypothetical protein LSTR_LSTR004065 [Laodelphax striatellus]